MYYYMYYYQRDLELVQEQQTLGIREGGMCRKATIDKISLLGRRDCRHAAHVFQGLDHCV